MPNALITGGAGFIGSHLAEHLLENGWKVYVIDDLSTGSFENIAGLRGRAGFEYVLDTVMNRSVMAELVDRADVVFHLAAAVGVKLIMESPVRTIETNVGGTEVVLEMANKKKRPVLIASTSEVYGKSTKIPFSEDDDLVIGSTQRGRWAYACSKALDEFLALAYGRERGLPVVVVRLFNTVGPRQTGRYGMVLPNFVRQALSGRVMTVFGDGSQSRCFGYVGDVVVALRKLMETERWFGQVYNVGSKEETTILGLAELIKGRLNSTSPIEFVPYEKAYDEGFEDMMRRVPNTQKIREAIDYEASTPLLEIIDRVAEYCRLTP